jgi:hypothetical protein
VFAARTCINSLKLRSECGWNKDMRRERFLLQIITVKGEPFLCLIRSARELIRQFSRESTVVDDPGRPQLPDLAIQTSAMIMPPAKTTRKRACYARGLLLR